MSIASELNSAIGLKSRRAFLQALGAAGIGLAGRQAWSAALPESVRQSLARIGKAVNLLEDGGFQGSAWGWQFTDGAKVAEVSRHAGHRSVHVQTESGDYALYLVLGPEIGKTYTLSGWVKTEAIVKDITGMLGNLGDATEVDVWDGKTFSSTNGIGLMGTLSVAPAQLIVGQKVHDVVGTYYPRTS